MEYFTGQFHVLNVLNYPVEYSNATFFFESDVTYFYNVLHESIAPSKELCTEDTFL